MCRRCSYGHALVTLARAGDICMLQRDLFLLQWYAQALGQTVHQFPESVTNSNMIYVETREQQTSYWRPVHLYSQLLTADMTLFILSELPVAETSAVEEYVTLATASRNFWPYVDMLMSATESLAQLATFLSCKGGTW